MKQLGIYETTSVEDTEALGAALGGVLRGGHWVGLEGPLGAGKTSLMRGLGKGLELLEGVFVTSPTFTVVNVYPGRHEVLHLDLYRLTSEDDLEAVGYYDLFTSENVVVVEWPGNVASARPDRDMIGVRFAIGEEGHRRLTVESRGLSGEDTESFLQALLPWAVS